MQNNGRHVADIAVLYPIHTLQGDHFFDGPKGPSDEWFKGEVAVTKIDYDDVSNWLTNCAGKDFTFIHPEVLDEKCTVTDGMMHLQNKINWEDYKVLVIPSCQTMSISNLKKIKDFYDRGGSIVFTTRLPSKSLEKGKDLEINKLVEFIFPKGENNGGVVQTNRKGGKAIFISKPSGQNLRQALSDINGNYDVDYAVNEDIRFIHKVIGDQELYYFANIGGSDVNIPVTLRGKMKLQKWDPHTGDIQDLMSETITNDKTHLATTKCALLLKPYHSVFWIGVKE